MSLTKNLLLFGFILLLASCSKDASLVDTGDALQNEPLTFRTSAYNFTASLKGENEATPVETKATGNIVVKVAKDESSISYKLIVANIEDVLFSHFHLAPAGVNGPVVAVLYPGPTLPAPNGVIAEGVITAEDMVGPLAGQDLSVLIEHIRNGGIYINVHTAANRGGELRGQL